MPPRKILVDLQPLQTRSSRDRGIGFYTFNHVRAMLRIADPGAWEIHGLVNAHLASTPKLDLLREEIGKDRWWVLKEGERNLEVEEREEKDRRAVAAAIEALSVGEGFSLYHNTSPFEWEVWLPLDLRRVAVVATVYDIIPRLFPDEYLSGATVRFRAEYDRILSGLKRADRVVAISECTRRDLITTLGLSPEQVSAIQGGVDPRFRVMKDESLFARVRERYGTGDRFVLYTGGYDFRKNFERLFEAFAMCRHRSTHKLVVVCRLSEEETRRILAMAAAVGLEKEVVLTGFVPDEEQVALYNMAEAFVFPSRYEGFGLPVLEAMTCGTPVIASNRSSLPEIAGDSAILVDPMDSAAIAEALDGLLDDPLRREELRNGGFERAARFAWEAVASRTIEAYSQVRERHGVPQARTARPRLGFFGPLSPEPTGVAEYCELLAPELSRSVDLHFFVDGYEPAKTAIRERYAWDDARLFDSYERHSPFDLVLYQMGNSIYHAYAYERLKRRPGVVVLHDFVLHHLVMAMTLQKGDEQGYRNEMERSHGEDGARAADLVVRGLGSDVVYHAYPMLAGVLEGALAMLVHSAHGEKRLRQAGYERPIAEVPMPIGGWLAREQDRRTEERETLGVGTHDLVVGTFGVQTPGRRHEVLLGAFADLLRANPHARCLIVGSVPDWYPLASIVERMGLAKSVLLTGRVSDERFDSLILASDICVNLRYPTRGETSAVTLRTMGYGRATIVTDQGSLAELNEGSVVPVEIGSREGAELAACLRLLADEPGLREELARRARAYVRTHHSAPASAAAYLASFARFGFLP